ncbi:MAG: hypothetical protein K9L88_03130 [Chromatiaceae bacterium]|nr:hypothetical protein [Chromatiaceae bacterium]MCF8015328.1 hypothetical protein [Chromatiaceae bacterium]
MIQLSLQPFGWLRLVLLALTLLSISPISATERLTNEPLDSLSNWDYVQDGNGAVWVAYYDTSKRLWLRRPDGSLEQVGGEDRNKAPSGLGLTAAQDRDLVAVLWRDKLPSKGLFLWDSDAEPTVVDNLDDGSEPLARILAASSNNRIHALWYGERVDPDTELRYHIYYRNQAIESGELSSMVKVMPGIYPRWAVGADGKIMVASWTAGEDPPQIAVRFRDVESGEFSSRSVIAENVEITPLIRAFRSGNRWFVLWHAQHEDNQAYPYSLHLAYTDDEGESWTREEIEALRGYDIASADIASDDTGRVFIAVDAIDRSPKARDEKMSVWLIQSIDNGSSWSMSDLRANGGMEAFHARSPSVALGPTKDQVLVIWEDWQTIRPRLFGHFSNDNGKSWQLKNQQLPNQPDGNLGLRFSVSSVFVTDDGYQVIAEQFTDTFLEKNLVTFDFTAADLVTAEQSDLLPSSIAANDDTSSNGVTKLDGRLQALRTRVSAFWKAMEAGDFSAAYYFYDPFFRALNTEQRFTSLTGNITYSDYETLEINLMGTIAQVNGVVRGNVIPFRAPTTGELIEQDERKVPIRDTWLWIDGQWYREFYSEGMDLKYTRY